MELVATCLFGLEKQLGEEIDLLGLKRIETIDGRVIFEGDEIDIARANINLRCAERIFIRLGHFRAETFDMLFEGTKALPFEEWLDANAEFPVSGHSIKSKLFSIPDCQKIVKKAIVDRLSSKYHISWFEEKGTKYKIEFFILKDEAHIMIETSGDALHKRGYRPEAGAAPLRETLAASLALTARVREDILLWDPFCGSGTIAIESALIAKGIAPGLNRGFSGEKYPRIPKELWDKARDEARGKIKENSSFKAYASDIDEDILDLTYENALRAGVEENIEIFASDARKIKRPDGVKGTLICNPPYGERMGEKEEAEALYRAIGKPFRDFYPWQVYILTASDRFETLYGKRADKTRKLYNGMIPCTLYQYYKPFDDKAKDNPKYNTKFKKAPRKY